MTFEKSMQPTCVLHMNLHDIVRTVGAVDPYVGYEPVRSVYECPRGYLTVLHFPSPDPLPDREADVGDFREEKPLTLTSISTKLMGFGSITSLTVRQTACNNPSGLKEPTGD